MKIKLFKEYNETNLSYNKTINGKKEGYWEIEKCNYKESGFYKNDKKEGEWKLYSKTDELSNITNYKEDIKEGYSEEYHFGVLRNNGYYINDKKSGLWKDYQWGGYDTGMVINCQFYNINLSYYLSKEKWIKINEKELNKINNIIHKCNYEINLNLHEEIYKTSEIKMFFYTFGKCNFISKLEDDYYLLCINGKYIDCDQLSELSNKIKTLK